jgi:hypothetical protein
MKNWDYDVSDYLGVMDDFLESRVSTEEYRRRFFEMGKKPCVLSDETDVVIQKAYGDADDYDEVVSLPCTINESELRERVANSVKMLEALVGHQPDK